MKRAGIILLLAMMSLLAGPLFADAAHHGGGLPWQTAWTWTSSFKGGYTDINGVFVGGTETRGFASINESSTTYSLNPLSGPKLFFGNGYTNDIPGPEGPQSPEVLRLDYPGGPWVADQVFGGSFCYGTSPCIEYLNSVASTPFTVDSGLNAVNYTVINAGASWAGGVPNTGTGCGGTTAPQLTFSRNPIDGSWWRDALVCGGGGVRSYGNHIDQVTGVQYDFAGVDTGGIFEGELVSGLTAGEDPMAWGTEEYAAASYDGTQTCGTAGRIMGMTEATGPDSVKREYASICLLILVRIDGCQKTATTQGTAIPPVPACVVVSGPTTCTTKQVVVSGACTTRWIDYWNNQTTQVSGSGFRGLSTIQWGGVDNLLAGSEGNNIQQYRIVPYGGVGSCSSPTDATCGTIEYINANFAPVLTSNLISPYNNWITETDPSGNVQTLTGNKFGLNTTQSDTMPTGTTYQYQNTASTGSYTERDVADAIVTMRTASAVYSLVTVPDSIFTTPPSAIRGAIMSPFYTDCLNQIARTGCAIYIGGYDAAGHSYFSWCQANPCSDTGVNLGGAWQPLHNTAWVARYGPPL